MKLFLRLWLALWLALVPAAVLAAAPNPMMVGLGKPPVAGGGGGGGLTFSLSDKTGGLNLSGGNLTASATSGTFEGARTTAGKSTGLCYYEFTVQSLTSVSWFVGYSAAGSTLLIPGLVDSNAGFSWSSDGRYFADGNDFGTAAFGGAGFVPSTSSVNAVALNRSAKHVWFRVNGGNWNNSGTANPATDTGGLSYVAAGVLFPHVSTSQTSGTTATFNFGATAFNGSVPAGFSGENSCLFLMAFRRRPRPPIAKHRRPRLAAWLLAFAGMLVVAPAEAAPKWLRGRTSISFQAPIGTLAPGAGFTGTQCSGYPGGTCLSAISRTTAQPAAHWIVPSDMRIVTDKLICVDADAKGGVAYVKFYGEGGTAQVNAPSVVADTDVNGNPRKRFGYCVTLDAAAWKAKTTSGGGRLFAEACPNDPTMQCRRIGQTYTDLNGDYPMVVLPRTAENDGTYTIGAGGTYATIAAAMNQACTVDGKGAPIFQFVATATYEIPPNSGCTPDGWPVMTAAPGVTATLRRAAAYSGNETDGSVWVWYLGGRMEFRGQGIVFDQRNWTNIQSTYPVWYNGVTFTNSIGTRDSFYWSGGVQQGYGSVGAYWDDVYTEYLFGGTNGNRYVRGAKIKHTLGDVFTGTHYVADSYVRDADSDFYFLPTAGLRVSYSGAGSATIEAGGFGGSVILKVNGSTVGSFAQGHYSTDTYPNINAIVTAINGVANWSATAQNGKGLMRADWILATGATAVTGGTDLLARFDIHGDLWQAYSGGNTRENVILRNNAFRESNNYSAFMFNDGTHELDFIIKNNLFLGSSAGNNWLGGDNMSHYVFDGNLFEATLTVRNTFPSATETYVVPGTAPYQVTVPFASDYISTLFVVDQTASVTLSATGGAPGVNEYSVSAGVYTVNAARAGHTLALVYVHTNHVDTTYSEAKNNILEATSTDSGTSCSLEAAFVNNLIGSTSICTPNVAPRESGTFTYTSTSLPAQFRALFTDYTNGDFSAASSTITGNLKPKIDDYDQRYCLRSANDNVGPWSKNCAAAAWPF